MENIIIESTKSTPYISFNSKDQLLEFRGQSYPEDSTKFYKPLYDWLKAYLKEVNGTTVVKIKLVYINTSSSKWMMTLFDIMEDAFQLGKDIIVKWHYDSENEIALESGEDFRSGLDLKFELIEDKP